MSLTNLVLFLISFIYYLYRFTFLHQNSLEFLGCVGHRPVDEVCLCKVWMFCVNICQLYGYQILNL